ncbi:hypothetical protein M9Y10_035305 [Tritrichomonas musculus]|uniref:Spindle assembly abnormal protein 6 N-terminal domain-containing protein n=1 Tax=Tritrichomonas musculus TaxID=1915356 RepID=A0ABR2KHA2_9EUKA
MSVFGESVRSASVLNEEMLVMDPTIQMDYKLVFNKEIFVNFITDQDKKENEEIVRFRIFIKGQPFQPDEVRLEMTMDTNVCLYLECTVNSNEFNKIKQENNLRVEFSSFVPSIVDLLERSVKKSEDPKSEQYLVQFKQGQDYGGTLIFLQKLKLRIVKVFTLNFNVSPQDFIRNQVQYRFNKIKYEYTLKETEINEHFRRISDKNPSLAKQITNDVRKILDKKYQKNF